MNRVISRNFIALGASLFLLALPQAHAQQLQPPPGQPVNGLTPAEMALFVAGQNSFEHSFSISEGLGPIFNVHSSCNDCHAQGGVGSPSSTITRFGHFDGVTFDPLLSLGGSLLQSSTINGSACMETVPSQANVVVNRISTPLFGDGLLEAIPDADILAYAATQTSVSGTVHWVQPLEDPSGPMRVGRFGWKAQQATLLSFSADAALNELGITNPLLPVENAPNGNVALLAQCDTVADPEDPVAPVGQRYIDKITDFQKFLAPPPQTPRSGMAGEAVFNTIGCADCHKAAWTTDNSPQVPQALRNKIIKPYSDFLLHDMGSAGDGIAQGNAGRNEMRTAPLWGMKARSFNLMHAGGNSIQAAIQAHYAPGSEANFAVLNYNALSPADNASLLAFLDSLGQLEFDMTGDNNVDYSDFQPIQQVYGQACSPNSLCARADINQDGVVNAADTEALLIPLLHAVPNFGWYPPPTDCNCNGHDDLQDILANPALDTNYDYRIDACNGMSAYFSVLNSTMKLTVWTFVPNEVVFLGYSFTGQGNGLAISPNMCINLLDQVYYLGAFVTDSNGRVQIPLWAAGSTPAWFIGQTVWAQGVVYRNGQWHKTPVASLTG